MGCIARLLVGMMLVALTSGGVEAAGTQGMLATWPSGSNGIPAGILADMVRASIPDETDKLFIFAQCYGGDVATDPKIQRIPQTAIGSATSPGEEAGYGGYHDDAARALLPDGRTGQVVHNEGVAGKYFGETPMTAGTLQLPKFVLVPTSPNGPIEGRVVIAYFGRPSTRNEWVKTDKQGHSIPAPASFQPPAKGTTQGGYTKTSFSDDADVNRIRANFAGQYQTTVTIVGGKPGRAGYNQPGNINGLLASIRAAGNLIKGPNGRNDPSKWQLVLFVGDHGEIGRRVAANIPCPQGSGGCMLAQAESSLPKSPGLVSALRDDTEASPGFTLYLDFSGRDLTLQRDASGYQDVFAPGDLSLEVQPSGGTLLVLTVMHQNVFDLSGDAILGNAPNEGVEVFFPVDRKVFADRLLDTRLDLKLINHTGQSLQIADVSQVSGGIERTVTHYRPAGPRIPTWRLVVAGLILMLVAAWLWWRSRKP